MQMSDTSSLRQAWEKKGDPPCKHPSTDAEYYLGAQTGDTICTICGRIVNEPQPKKLQKRKKK